MQLGDLIGRATVAAVAACGLIGASPLAIAAGVLASPLLPWPREARDISTERQKPRPSPVGQRLDSVSGSAVR